MYKVIIADDEFSIRQRLLKQLDNYKETFEVVGVFENGYDALINGVNLSPDLIITDIRMPYIDGISLIKAIKQELPLIQAIIISGYDSFDYAKQAISLGVIGYISKPVTAEELEITLLKVKEQLDEKNNHDFNVDELKNKAESALSIIQSNDLLKLTTLKKLDDVLKDKLIEDGLGLDFTHCSFLVFDIDEEIDNLTYENIEKTNLLLKQALEKEENNKKDFLYYYFFKDGNLNLFLTFNEEINQTALTSFFNQILLKVNKISNISVSCGISECKDINDLDFSFRRLYRHALSSLEYRTVIGNNIVIFYKDINAKNTSTFKMDENEYKEISYEILYGNNSKATTKIEEFLKIISSDKYNDNYFFLLDNLIDSIIKSCIDTKKLFLTYKLHKEILDEISESKTFDSTLYKIKELLKNVLDINKTIRISGVESSFLQIKSFLSNNFTNSSLSLDDVANELNYSVSYISAILKKNGTSFTKLLTDYRMAKAKTLLLDAKQKIVVIASLVGYDDPYYFSHCFKKYYGLSPMEYRNKK